VVWEALETLRRPIKLSVLVSPVFSSVVVVVVFVVLKFNNPIFNFNPALVHFFSPATPIFMHIGVVHLLGNLLFQFGIGRELESVCGFWRTVSILFSFEILFLEHSFRTYFRVSFKPIQVLSCSSSFFVISRQSCTLLAVSGETSWRECSGLHWPFLLELQVHSMD
jgi:hypothetical protein